MSYNVTDLIERQAAIDVLSLGKEILSRVLDDTDVVGVDREKYSWGLGLIESYIKDIEELPSAQSEPLTDAEQRIFIEAMWREKSVCMAVDKEFPDAKVNLTDVCREIVRKVKGVLWT